MLAGRALQGFGGGLVFALSYVIIRIIYSEALWPRAMALVSGMWGVSTLFGPALGGIFAELDVWRAAFWAVAGVAISLLTLAFAVLPKRSRDGGERSPLAVLQLALLAGAVMAISVGSVSNELNHNVVGVAVAVVLVGALIVAETRGPARLLPSGALNVFCPLGATYAALALLVFSVPGSEIFVPYLLQVLHDLSPLTAGYLAAVMAASWTLAQIGGSGLKGGGARKAILAAGPVMIVGFIGMAWLMPAGSNADVMVLSGLVVGLLLVGFGVGLAWPHLLTRVLQVAPEDEQNLAASAITTIQLFATALGAAVAGMIANLAGLTTPGGNAGAASAAYWLFVLFAIAPLLAFPLAISITANMRNGPDGAGS
jgi:MFS family permease